jgi:hypothetical protein
MTSGDPRFRRDSERLRGVARTRLDMLGRPTTDRRIGGLVWYDQDDEPPEPFITVGRDLPDGAKGDPVLAILESARFDDMYFVCTFREFGGREAPRAIALGKWWRVVDEP